MTGARAAVMVTRLFRYPVKSLAGVEARSLRLTPRGPLGDREWMLVDRDGVFMSQRGHPRMCLIRPALGRAALSLALPGRGALRVPLAADARPRLRVSVWDDACEALDEGDEAAAALSAFLGSPCRLVRFASGSRPAFADDAPVLLASEDSLADLDARLPSPVRVERFRPNVVVRGAAPYAEDGWRAVAGAGLALRVEKPCSRCGIVTVDPASAERGDEPLRTLASYRRGPGGGVFFGVYCVPEGAGVLRVGDRLAPEPSR